MLAQVQATEHVLAAVVTASHQTPGLSFLEAKLLRHMQIQSRIHQGKPSAVAAAFATLSAAYQWLPTRSHEQDLFSGIVSLSLVFISIEDRMVYTGSLGSCSIATDCSEAAAQSFPLPVSRWAPAATTAAAEPGTLLAQAFPLEAGSYILGSADFWCVLLTILPSRECMSWRELDSCHYYATMVV